MTKADLLSVLAELKARCAEGDVSKDCSCSTCSQSKGWLAHDHESVVPISSGQRASIQALIAYVANKTGQNSFRVERMFSDQFCIPNVNCLPDHEYDRALCYLAGQVPHQQETA